MNETPIQVTGQSSRLRTRRLRGPGAALVLALALASGCGSPSEDTAPPADTGESAPETTEAEETTEAGETTEAEETADPEEEPAEAAVITITDFDYVISGTISAGAEVTVVNEDSVGHTVTSDEEGLFDVVVGGGEEASFIVPDEPGEYGFYCVPHPYMTSTLVVG
ncbi:MAG: cupredoxin domain-containing protein [Actinomycetota bacterium]|nr:cupredoxin domain-containing protein [Actinomycetota bacterium]